MFTFSTENLKRKEVLFQFKLDTQVYTTGPLYLIVMGVNVFFLLADGELIEHMSTVRDMQIETVANRISTISSLVRAGAAKH